MYFRWMLYGTVSARIKTASRSGGIVSSFIFRNAVTGDEIDYEWVGKDPQEVQSNYYWVLTLATTTSVSDVSSQRH